MTVVAVIGDATTTSSVALAAEWPNGTDVIVLEADPGGGALAGWLDTPTQPTLATIVANVGPDAARNHRSTIATFEAMSHRSASGVRFVANAVRARAAHRAVEEASTTVLPAIAHAAATIIVDAGACSPAQAFSPTLQVADVVVVVHHQAAASAAAATVRVERLVEMMETLASLHAPIVLAIIGSAPFDRAEIASFVEESAAVTLQMVASIADDPLAAATIAGRSGVSAKRLRRLPLMRDASRLATMLDDLLGSPDAQRSQLPGELRR